MNPKIPLKKLCFPLLLALAATHMANAQEKEKTTEEDILILSPFVVDSSKDVGYLSTSTLAGTRLKTKLNEVGTAISVVNAEFLQDLAATDAGTLLSYTVGTEVGGMEGNFAGGDFSGTRPNQNGARSAPENNQRIRGLAAAESTRNYFLTSVPFDAYNTESVTINRGPNALLFGIGSPGGVIENSTKQPIFGKDHYEVSLRVGEHGTHRETIDLNKVLIPGRLALRLNAMNEDISFRQKPAYEKDRRTYLALDAVIFENKGSRFLDQTRIRGNAELIRIESNPPNVLSPNDSFSSFWKLPDDVEGIAATVSTALPDFWYEPYESARLWDNSSVHPAFGQVGPLYSTFLYQQLGVYYPGGGSADIPGQDIQGGFGRMLWPAGSGRSRTDMIVTLPWTDPAYIEGYSVPSLQDRGIFDYYNNLFSGDLNRVERKFSVGNITLEQTFLRGLAGLEVTYSQEKAEPTRFMPFSAGADAQAGAADIHIDTGMYLTNDTPNPNVGRPVVRIQRFLDDEAIHERHSVRATGFANIDGRRLFDNESTAFWFGRHTATAVYQTQTIDNTVWSYNWGYDTEDQNLLRYFNNSPRIDMHRRQFVPIVYLGDSVANTTGADALRVHPVDMIWPESGDTFQVYYLDQAARQIKNGEVSVRRYQLGGNAGRREIDSQVFSLQSFLLKDHLIGLAGWRKDNLKAWENVDLDNDVNPDGTLNDETSNRLPAGDWNPAAMALEDAPAADLTGETLTWSVVGVYPEVLLGDLPFGSELRLFYNSSENFNPVGVRRNVWGEVLDAPSANTKEYGAMVELAEGKFSIRFNIFETKGVNFSTLGGLAEGNGSNWVVSSLMSDILGAVSEGYTVETLGWKDQGIDTLEQGYDMIFDLMPQRQRDLLNPRVVNGSGATIVQFDDVENAVGTEDFSATGWELDLVANPLRGLRLSFNVARQETVESNIGPELEKLIRETYENVLASPFRDLFVSPHRGEFITFQRRYEGFAVNPLNAALTAEGTQSLEQREWRANMVANYQFQDGTLKGFGLGGAARYQSKQAIGYPNLINENGLIVPDLQNPFFGDDEIRGDVWVSYRRRILDGKVGWRIQLNVRNAFGDDSLVAVRANPNGDIANVRIPPTTTWFLSNTFRF